MELNEFTFSSLFGEHIDQNKESFNIKQIEIPIIQRDYAQGRTIDKVERVRNRFLETIYDALINKKRLTLDFVYGEVKNDKLIPLDGQQRLTTLFLLHWYVAKKENRDPHEYEFLYNFSYFTRPSARNFCLALVEFVPNFSSTISDSITDQAWFQYQWHNDPTITGMLVMIDAIHNKFQSVTNLWESLVEKPCISFYFLPISDMGLSDDLYIKMNSRGKPLTDFEHFKAEFEGMIKTYDENLSNEINKKFDIDWTDMLFPYRGQNNIIDDEFMRYYFFISDILCYLQDVPMTKDEFELMKALYSKQNANYRENIKFLVQSFDCWAGLDIKQWFDDHFTNDCYETNKTNLFQDNVNIFQQCCDTYGEFEGRNRKFPLNMTLFLYAIIIYLQNQSIVSDNDFRRRIRIVRNLIWNSQYEIRADGQRNNMPQLLAETRDIILSGTISSGTGFNQKQKEEERAKIEWLNNHPLEQDRLFNLEDCPLLYGCIAIVGLDNYRNFDKFRFLFEIQNRKLIHRSLLTCGDYTQEVTWNQHHFMGNNNDSTWKDLFHPSDKRVGFSRTSETINLLLDKLTEPSEAGLNAIIDTYKATSRETFDWMYYFVKYPSMLKGNEGIYWMEEYPYNMYALHHSTLRGYNWQALAIAVLECAPDKFTLGNWAYNQYEPLQKEGIKINVRNWGFELIDSSTNTVSREIHVPQNNDGIDCVDRIEFLLQNL